MLPTCLQTRCLSLARLVFAFLVAGCVHLDAESPFEELKVKLDQALEENSKKVATDQRIKAIGKLYSDRLASLRTDFVVQGNLDGVLEAQEEMRRFKDSGEGPDDISSIDQLARLQRIYINEIKKIQSEEMVGMLHYYNAYEDSLLKREKELVRIGTFDKAVEVREERDRVKKIIRKLSRGRADPASMRPEDVFSRPGETEADVPVDDTPVTSGNGSVSSEALDELKAEFNQSLSAHRETVASGEQAMYEEYMKELQVRRFHYQNEGSLDGVLALQAEMKLLEDEGRLSNDNTELKHLAAVQRNFARDLREMKSGDRESLLAIFRQYLVGMRELEQSLVRRDLIELAILVRNERERISEVTKKRVRQELVLHLHETKKAAGD